jgi:hypothetical protein
MVYRYESCFYGECSKKNPGQDLRLAKKLAGQFPGPIWSDVEVCCAAPWLSADSATAVTLPMCFYAVLVFVDSFFMNQRFLSQSVCVFQASLARVNGSSDLVNLKLRWPQPKPPVLGRLAMSVVKCCKMLWNRVHVQCVICIKVPTGNHK